MAENDIQLYTKQITDLVGHHNRDHGNKIKNTMVTTNLDRERWRPCQCGRSCQQDIQWTRDVPFCNTACLEIN